jgi:uncharacterized protein (TIGR03118 family)
VAQQQRCRIQRTRARVFLYATNFRAGTIDVFDSKFQPAKLAGSFSDPTLPSGYAAFGIALVDGNLFVTYAQQDALKHDDAKGPGHGFVDVFDTDGNLITRFASRGTLNSPWGIARAPLSFGPFSGQILIGNFGDGRISGFTSDGSLRGQLRNTNGRAVAIEGLWSMMMQWKRSARASSCRCWKSCWPKQPCQQQSLVSHS